MPPVRDASHACDCVQDCIPGVWAVRCMSQCCVPQVGVGTSTVQAGARALVRWCSCASGSPAPGQQLRGPVVSRLLRGGGWPSWQLLLWLAWLACRGCESQGVNQNLLLPVPAPNTSEATPGPWVTCVARWALGHVKEHLSRRAYALSHDRVHALCGRRKRTWLSWAGTRRQPSTATSTRCCDTQTWWRTATRTCITWTTALWP